MQRTRWLTPFKQVLFVSHLLPVNGEVPRCLHHIGLSCRGRVVCHVAPCQWVPPFQGGERPEGCVGRRGAAPSWLLLLLLLWLPTPDGTVQNAVVITQAEKVIALACGECSLSSWQLLRAACQRTQHVLMCGKLGMRDSCSTWTAHSLLTERWGPLTVVFFPHLTWVRPYVRPGSSATTEPMRASPCKNTPRPALGWLILDGLMARLKPMRCLQVAQQQTGVSESQPCRAQHPGLCT